MEIIPNVHLISGAAVNCYLIVEPDGLTLIDTGLPNYKSRISNYLTSIERSPEIIRQILITHADSDHVGTLAYLKAAIGAMAYASALEAKAIAAGKASRDLSFTGLAKILFVLLNRFFQYQPVEVDQILKPDQELPILGGLQVISTPGHTPEHISFFSPLTGILFAGDSMRASDKGLHPSRGVNTWDEHKALESFKLQIALSLKIVCVGHGPVVRNVAT